MTANRPSSIGRTWILRLAAAAGLSLLAVCVFITAVGAVFWAFDPQRLPHYVSVLHSIAVGNLAHGRSAVTLFWTMDQVGTSGCQLHLAIHSLDTNSSALLLSGDHLKPYSITAGPSPDQILVGTWDGEIQLLDLRTPRAQPRCIGRQTGGAVAALSLTDDGHCVVSQSAFGMSAWNLDERTNRWQRDDLGAFCHVPLPGSQSAIVGMLDHRLLEIDLQTGQTLRVLAHYASPVLGAALSPDGTKLAALRADDTLLLLDTRTATPLWERRIQRPNRTSPGRLAAFSPCGNFLVTAAQSDGNALSIWNVATGQSVRELRGHQKVVQGATFVSCDELRSWAADGTLRVWDVQTGVTRQVNEFSPPSA